MSATPPTIDPLVQIVKLHRRVEETNERSKGALGHRDLAIRIAVEKGAATQADVARATGLTRTRVAQIVNGAGQ